LVHPERRLAALFGPQFYEPLALALSNIAQQNVQTRINMPIAGRALKEGANNESDHCILAIACVAIGAMFGSRSFRASAASLIAAIVIASAPGKLGQDRLGGCNRR
jgi:hypothetical protein